MSSKVDFTTSTGSDGWTVIRLSDNLVLYLRKGVSRVTLEGGSWRSEEAAPKPADLNLSNYYVGVVGGEANDTAVSVSGAVQASGNVVLAFKNSYAGTVTTDVYWGVYIMEIVG